MPPAVWRRLKDHKAALAIIPRSSDQITDLKSLLDVDEQHLDLHNIQVWALAPSLYIYTLAHILNIRVS